MGQKNQTRQDQKKYARDKNNFDTEPRTKRTKLDGEEDDEDKQPKRKVPLIIKM